MITAWNCPSCQRVVPLDHFAATKCALVVHPAYAKAVLESDTDYYGKGLVTVTSGLSCPRSRAIEQGASVTVNPLDYNALIVGSAWDKAMEQFAESGTAKIRLQGEVEGIKLSGEIDQVMRVGGELLICDHKHTNNFQYAHLKKEEKPRIEYVIQTSLYAELYFQQFSVRPDRGVVWYSFSGGNVGSSPPLMPKVYEFMDVKNCLDHKPYGGDYTVRELYQQSANYLSKPADPFALPLAGETMSFGTKSYCEYCQVSKACRLAATGAPF